MGPPPKRRKLVILSSDDEPENIVKGGEDQGSKGLLRRAASKSTATRSLPSRSKTKSSSALSSQSHANNNAFRDVSASSSPEKRKRVLGTKKDEVATKSCSLHNFFQPATEQGRWSSQPKPSQGKKIVEDIEDLEDCIEDDYNSFDDIFAPRPPAKKNAVQSSTKDGHKSEIQPSHSQKGDHSRDSVRPAKRFLMGVGPDDVRESHRQKVNAVAELSGETDTRPWADRYAPCNLDELAVHKRKVQDVRSWLMDAFTGNSRRRLLVLRGPAGSGKTTTISLLSKALGYDILEWKIPLGAEYATLNYTSMSAQFDEFLARGNNFGSLDLVGDDRNMQQQENSSRRRLILIEEFPSTLRQASLALSMFRSSLLRYLASSTPSPHGVDNLSPPIVVIVTETLLNTAATAFSDNFTVQRLLGTDLCRHPGTSIIEFNPVAPTLMSKAIDLILKKEAQHSKRKKIHAAAIVKKFSGFSDIRSAISSLEFLCLRGSNDGDWASRLGTTIRAKALSQDIPTRAGRESLEMITQREASLGIFHAVGKVVYNKRDDPSREQNVVLPPEHLLEFRRPKVSQVSIDDLINETGTDVHTFVSALHENYVPSCDGPSFTSSLEGCIQALSDCDILGPDSRRNLQASRIGVGSARTPNYSHGASTDALRQDEISFQVAVRGLLFSLPCPVKRRLVYTRGSGQAGDTYKMYFPTSLRSWKKTEEIEGLLDAWERRLLNRAAATGAVEGTVMTVARGAGVGSWKSRGIAGSSRDSTQPQAMVVTRISRAEVLLQQLPYMAKIWQGRNDAKELEMITQFEETNAQHDGISDDELDHDSSDFLLTEQHIPAVQSQRPPWGDEHFPNSGSQELKPPAIEEVVEKLILSDDDIEDD